MRIDDNGMTNVNAQALGRTQGAEAVEQQDSRRPERLRSGDAVQDRVNLSSLASSLAAEQDFSVERQQMLARLESDYRAGRLEVDAGRVADGLIDQALEDSL